MIATIAWIATIAGLKRSAIVAIMWKPLFSDRNDHSNHMETSLYGNCSAIKVATPAIVAIVATVAIIWKPGFNIRITNFTPNLAFKVRACEVSNQ